MKLNGIHHVAYRCNNAKQTVAFYKQALGMDLLLAISENQVPSTKDPDPYMHVFLDAGRGNVLAFFELPNSDDMGKDPHTPAWVQHLAFEVDSLASLLATKAHLEAMDIEVLGPVEHTIFKSIYFFDPNGHRLELAANTATPQMLERLQSVAQLMVDEWDVTKKAPQHAAWLHDGSMEEGK
nr:VOC family protein [Paraferrimonas sp. SM1919]